MIDKDTGYFVRTMSPREITMRNMERNKYTPGERFTCLKTIEPFVLKGKTYTIWWIDYSNGRYKIGEYDVRNNLEIRFEDFPDYFETTALLYVGNYYTLKNDYEDLKKDSVIRIVSYKFETYGFKHLSEDSGIYFITNDEALKLFEEVKL